MLLFSFYRPPNTIDLARFLRLHAGPMKTLDRSLWAYSLAAGVGIAALTETADAKVVITTNISIPIRCLHCGSIGARPEPANRSFRTRGRR
jgi:hypothetical protein